MQEDKDFRKKREEHSITIRKEERHNIISRRRNLEQYESEEEQQSNEQQSNEQKSNEGRKLKLTIVDHNYSKEIEKFILQKYSLAQIDQLLFEMRDGDILKKHHGVIGIRKILCVVESEVPNKLCDIGAVPLLITFAEQSEYPQLKLQAIWALANIASGPKEVCQYLISLNCIPFFVSVINELHITISEQAVWALGNIGAECTEYRDTILELGGLSKVIQYIEPLTSAKKISDGCWTLGNLCRGEPAAKFEITKEAIPILGQSLKNDKIKDPSIISDMLWTIAHMTQGGKHKLNRWMETGVCPKIFTYLTHEKPGVYIPALRIIGNFSAGYEDHTDVLLQNDFLTIAETLMSHKKQIVRKETAWTISNIAAGTHPQILMLLQKISLIHKLTEALAKDSDEVRYEILWAFANFQRAGIPQQILMLYQLINIIDKVSTLLDSDLEYIVEGTVNCLYHILECAEEVKTDVNALVKQAQEKGLIAKLQLLLEHRSKKVYLAVVRVMESFLEYEQL